MVCPRRVGTANATAPSSTKYSPVSNNLPLALKCCGRMNKLID